MKKIIIATLVIINGTLFVSCESNSTQDVSGIVENPTYNTNIKRVIDAKCVSCHSVGGSTNQEPYFDTYDEVKATCLNSATGNGQAGTVLCKIDPNCTQSIMPTSGAMPQPIIDMVKRWAAQGYNQ
jgi:hypothetical protein